MDPWLTILFTAVASATLTLVGVYGVYQWVVKPDLKRRMEQLEAQVETLEQRVAAGVRRGVAETVRDIPDQAVKSTTRSVVRFGAELVEGGLSSLFNEPSKKRQDDPK
jgi:hypothetical protein